MAEFGEFDFIVDDSTQAVVTGGVASMNSLTTYSLRKASDTSDDPLEESGDSTADNDGGDLVESGGDVSSVELLEDEATSEKELEVWQLEEEHGKVKEWVKKEGLDEAKFIEQVRHKLALCTHAQPQRISSTPLSRRAWTAALCMSSGCSATSPLLRRCSRAYCRQIARLSARGCDSSTGCEVL